MLLSTTFIVALLPAVSLAQGVYSVTVGGQVTAFTLPPFPSDSAAAQATPAAPATPAAGTTETAVTLPSMSF